MKRDSYAFLTISIKSVSLILLIQQVIRMFKTRIKDWYIKSGKILSDKKFHLHFDFVLINLCCIIIDTMSQYYFDDARSTGDVFHKFLRKEFPEFHTKLDPTKSKFYYRTLLLLELLQLIYIFSTFKCQIFKSFFIKFFDTCSSRKVFFKIPSSMSINPI